MTDKEMRELSREWDKALAAVFREENARGDRLEDQHRIKASQMKPEPAATITYRIRPQELEAIRIMYRNMTREQFSGWCLGNAEILIMMWIEGKGSVRELKEAHLFYRLAHMDDQGGGKQ